MCNRAVCEPAQRGVLLETSDIAVLTSIIDAVTEGGEAEKTAELMINEFGGLSGILAATVRELKIRSNTPLEVITELERLKCITRAILRYDIYKGPLLEDLKSVKNYFRSKLLDKRKEQLNALFLDNNFNLIAEKCLQEGTVDHVSVYPREIILSAIENSATQIILAHNHPSGEPSPSVADILMTNDLVTACSYLGINVADHIIIARAGEFSFRENNLMEPGRD